jgi:hypothetical protein
MEVADRIAALETRAVGPHGNVPVEAVVIKAVKVIAPSREKAPPPGASPVR